MESELLRGPSRRRGLERDGTAEGLGLWVRENKRLKRRLAEAKLRMSQAYLKSVDFPAARKLDKAMIRQLGPCRWVEELRHPGYIVTILSASTVSTASYGVDEGPSLPRPVLVQSGSHR